MNLKIKKLIFLSGFTGVTISSIFSFRRVSFEKNIENYSYESDLNIISHRGFSSIEIENSEKAIEKGFESKCSDGVEVDVRLTKDDYIILSHNKVVKGIGNVEEKNFVDIKNKKYAIEKESKLKCYFDTLLDIDGKLEFDRNNLLSNKKEKMISINRVIENDYNKTLLIDIKFNNNSDKFINKLNNIFKDYEGNLDIVFQSTDYDSLTKMKGLYPNYKYQLIIKDEKDLKYLDSDFNMFGIRKNLINKEIIENASNKGKSISIWTINSYDDYNELNKNIGEYIQNITIITDYPDEICYLYDKSKKKKLK